MRDAGKRDTFPFDYARYHGRKVRRLCAHTSQRGDRCQQRLARQWPNLTAVHTPIHASWLNQVEIYFSIVQRKALTPNDFNLLTALEDRLLAFQQRYQAAAKPFRWRFTRRDLDALLAKLAARAKAA